MVRVRVLGAVGMVRERVTYYSVRCDHEGCTAATTTDRTRGRQKSQWIVEGWQRFGNRDFCPKHLWPECGDCGKPMRPRTLTKDQARFTVRYSDRWPLCQSCNDRPTPEPKPEPQVDKAAQDAVRFLVSDQPDADRLLELLGIGET